MSRLAPDLFTRRFGDLVQMGRSRLPSLAPDWTDHNVHDPGITLLELLAWVTEAQIYSLSRSRRDERSAYAALMGIRPHGTRPARGLIWPDHDDPSSPAATISRTMVIERDAAVHMSKSDEPTFIPSHRILWIPARIAALTTHLADGATVDHTGANRRGGPAFKPFGEVGGPGDTLRMKLEATGVTPLLRPDRPRDAYLVIGVRADAARAGNAARILPDAGNLNSPLEVTFVSDMTRVPLRIVEDTTDGFIRTGACVLDVSGVQDESRSAILEFHAPRGFNRAPRTLRIEPNVVPVVQRQEISEPHRLRGLPDEGFDLGTPGLAFEPGSAPVTIEISGPNGTEVWERRERLSDCGPSDRVYEFDPAAGHVKFGNGVNGEMPPAEAEISVSYTVSQGAGGNIASNRKWIVHGISGLFGVNPDPIEGGEDPSGGLEQRRVARLAVSNAHALVSAADIAEAARALPGLEVARAWMMPPQAGDVATGTMRLIVMQARPTRDEPQTIPETTRWLDAVRRALAPRIPLGSRLVVAAPRYVGFTIRARIEAEPRRDPAQVRQSVLDQLKKRLTLVNSGSSTTQRPFGLPVTNRDLTAWIQALPDVRRVTQLQIRLADGGVSNEVKVPRNGLPRPDFAQSEIEFVRPATAGGER